MQLNSHSPTALQKLFPGCTIETKWSLPDAMEHGPFIAMYLILGANITKCPRGVRGFYSITIEGHEYVLHEDDYDFSHKLAQSFIIGYMQMKAINCDSPEDVRGALRAMPALIVDGLRWMKHDATVKNEIAEDRIRAFWMLPDTGACGHYRAHRPFTYMEKEWQKTYFAQLSSYINYKALTYFDTLFYSRVPTMNSMGILQNLKLEGKTLVFETDDDLYNIPEWSYAHKNFTPGVKNMYDTAMGMADLIMTSTETLKERINRPDITHVTPNLIDLDRYQRRASQMQRPMQKQYVGFFPKRVPAENGTALKFFNAAGGELEQIHRIKMEEAYSPIRIIWAGSNTHDKDLDQIVNPVLMLGEKYGIAIRFYFLGYAPPEFIHVIAGPGNTHDGTMAAKPEYSYFMEYVHPVNQEAYPAKLCNLEADIALCPLYRHPFNLSKSNIKPLEMAAAGTPSIVTDYGPYSFIKDGYDGIKVKFTDNETELTASWVNAIESLIRNRQKRIELANNAYNRVREEFSWQSDSPNRQKWDEFFRLTQGVSAARKRFLKIKALNALVNDETTQCQTESSLFPIGCPNLS